jgi:hypothetical protein
MSAVEPLDSDVFLDSRAVRRRYGGRSDMAFIAGPETPSSDSRRRSISTNIDIGG